LKQSLRKVGTRGEDLAVRHLRSRGYSILARNMRTPFGEIDIVAEHDGILVFLEVKARTSDKAGPPHASVTRTKQRHIIRSAQYYILKNRLRDVSCRTDVISINLDRQGRLENLRHIRNAFGLEALERSQ